MPAECCTAPTQETCLAVGRYVPDGFPFPQSVGITTGSKLSKGKPFLPANRRQHDHPITLARKHARRSENGSKSLIKSSNPSEKGEGPEARRTSSTTSRPSFGQYPRRSSSKALAFSSIPFVPVRSFDLAGTSLWSKTRTDCSGAQTTHLLSKPEGLDGRRTTAGLSTNGSVADLT